jgi:Mg2+ and Co2+ transporter CorA
MDEKPPLFQTWKSWYWLVLGFMILQVIVYFWISNSFA